MSNLWSLISKTPVLDSKTHSAGVPDNSLSVRVWLCSSSIWLLSLLLKIGCDDETGVQFVSANASNISDLSPFQGSCQPAWLFLIGGKLRRNVLFICSLWNLLCPGEIVDVMHGSNPVKMRNMILDLWRNCVLDGQRRGSITVAEAAPGVKLNDNPWLIVYCV